LSEDRAKIWATHPYTYYSATEAWFTSRRFPIEIIRPHRYMKIKSKLFWQSKNRRFIAKIETFAISYFAAKEWPFRFMLSGNRFHHIVEIYVKNYKKG
jgi:hypothetical protein